MATQTSTAPATIKAGTPPKGMMKVANNIIAPLLRSPLHRLISGSLMLLTMTGRKSGRRITTPVSYLPNGEGRLILFTFSPWWKNLQGGALVTLRIKGRDVPAVATPDNDTDHGRRRDQSLLAHARCGERTPHRPQRGPAPPAHSRRHPRRRREPRGHPHSSE